MRRLAPAPRRFAPAFLAAAAAGLLLAPGGAAGQNPSRHMMMVQQEDGAAPSVLHFSMPDFRRLRTPDYVREDLPLFRTRLSLTDAQYTQVEKRLGAYLDSFTALAADSLPRGNTGMLALDAPGDGPVQVEGGGARIELELGDAVREALRDSGLDGAEGELGGQVGITIQAGSGDEAGSWIGGEDAGDGEGPQASVMLSVQTPDGVELPDEVRKQLEARAREIAEKLKERLEKMQADGEDPLGAALPAEEHLQRRRQQFEDLRAMSDEFAAAKKLLGREFVADVQATLQDEQLARWPSLERALVRRKTLPDGRLDGERTDLVALAEQMHLTDDAGDALAGELEAYEINLHDALTRRNAFLAVAQPRIDQALQQQDPGAALALVDRATQLRVAVRAVNEQYAQGIAGQLDREQAEAFATRVREVSFPRAYARTPGLRIFRAARRLEGLEEETLMQILEIEQSYRQELERANERIHQVIRRRQPLEARRGIEQLGAIMNARMAPMMGQDEEIRAALEARRDLESRAVARLGQQLTTEQIAVLPKLPKPQHPARMFFETSTDPTK